MELTYPINLVGHDAWMASGYAFDLARGDVITQDGEILGTWRVVDYDPEAYDPEGSYEFIPIGQEAAMFVQGCAFLGSRVTRGLALSRFVRAIKEWNDAEPA